MPIFIGILSLVGTICLHWIVPAFHSLNKVEAMTYDWRVRIAKSQAPASDRFAGALIDNDSIQAIADGSIGYVHGLYWPRYIYGDLIDELNHRGAETIAFDVIFSEERPDHGHLELSSGELVSSDQIFAFQMRSSSNVIIVAEPNLVPPPLFSESAASLALIQTEADRDGVLRRIRPYENVRIWHPAIQRILGQRYHYDLSSALIDESEIEFRSREYDPLMLPLDENGHFDILDIVDELPEEIEQTKAPPFDTRRVWHLGITIAARHLELDLKQALVDEGSNTIRIPTANGTELQVPLDDSGNMLVNWEINIGDDSLVLDQFSHLLSVRKDRLSGLPVPDSAEWRDRIVLVGSIATGNDLTDLGPTPLARSAYYLTTHWNVANSLISGRFVHLMPLGVQSLLLVLFGVLTILVTLRLPVPWSTVLLVTVGTSYIGFSVWLFNATRLWIPIVAPLAGSIAVPHFATALSLMIVDRREKRHIRNIFSQIVSPNIVDELLKEERLHLHGTRRTVTVLFADLRGFTAVTDTDYRDASAIMESSTMTDAERISFLENRTQEVLATVNLYLSQIAEEVKSHSGTLDKYIGDCVMAFWGAPTPVENSATRCVEAAVATQKRILALNTARRKQNEEIKARNALRTERGESPLAMLPILDVGIGINTGDAIVGLMGSTHHILNYTVFGRDVNLASRLERVAGKGKIIIGETTHAELQLAGSELGKCCKENPPVALKGIKNLVTTYEVQWLD